MAQNSLPKKRPTSGILHLGQRQDFENTAKNIRRCFKLSPRSLSTKYFRNFSPTSRQLFHQKHYVYILFSVLVENLRVKVRDYVRKVNTVKDLYYEIFITLTVSARKYMADLFQFRRYASKELLQFLASRDQNTEHGTSLSLGINSPSLINLV